MKLKVIEVFNIPNSNVPKEKRLKMERETELIKTLLKT